MCLNNTLAMQDDSNRESTLHKHEQLELNYDYADNCNYVDNLDHLATDPTELTIVQWNTRGILGKVSDLHKLLRLQPKQRQIDICIVSETWLNDRSQKLVQIPGYQLVCNNRKNRKGGGVGILISNHIKFRERKDLTNNTNVTENCFIEILSSKGNIIVGSLYRPPNTVEDRFHELIDYVLESSNKESKQLILGMDHNLDLLQSHRHSGTNLFLDKMINNCCLPLITKPSRITKNSSTLIDNIFVSKGLQTDVESGLLINDCSDHLPCYAKLCDVMPGLKEPIKIETRKLTNPVINSIRDDLNKENWNKLSELTTDEAFHDFHDKITTSLNRHAPIRTKTILKGKLDEPWVTTSLKRSMSKQQFLYKKTLDKSCNETDRNKYKQYRNCLTKIKRFCKKDYYKNKCIEFKSNTRKLWKLINFTLKKTNNKTCIIDYIQTNKINEYKGELIAESMAKYFAGVGKDFANNIPQPATPIAEYIKKIIPSQNSMFMSPTTSEEISDLIKNLPNKTSSGYDDISNKLLKDLNPHILKPLEIIFNKSLLEGKFPELMKIAEVIPLYKGKEKYLSSNYRPISLLITISKILEKIVYKRTYDHLEQTNQLYKSQYGFRTKHSCENAVSELVGEIIKSNDSNKYTISVFLDLSKAFDTLEHKILFTKLDRYGIRGPCLDWFKSYLNERSLRIKCRTSDSSNEQKSTLHQVEYGAPQGSCLGPLLFLIFTNDLYLNVVHTNCILFADDTTLYISHKKLSYAKWCMEEDLKTLHDWFNANKLTLNLNKTVAMLFSRNKTQKIIDLKVGSMAIPQVPETKFLGVWLDSGLNWNKQINMLENKIKQNKHLLQCSANMLDLPTKRLVYFSHIYSHIRYCILIWGNSLTAAKLNKLQRLQTNCINLIKKYPNTTSQYQDLGILNIKNIISLENMKLGYKFSNKQLPVRIHELLINDQNQSSLKKSHRYPTRHKSLPNKPKGKYVQYGNSFLSKWIDDFSKLTPEIKEASNLKIFATKCKKLLLGKIKTIK